jgi:hypothetical protein
VNEQSTELATIQEVWNPETGELIPATDTPGVAKAVAALRAFSWKLKAAIGDATTVLVEESKRQGTKTLHLDGTTAVIGGGTETVWDIEALRTSLEELGCPQERIEELIKTEVTYKVDGRVAKQLAGANPDYAIALELAKSVVEKPYYVTIR